MQSLELPVKGSKKRPKRRIIDAINEDKKVAAVGVEDTEAQRKRTMKLISGGIRFFCLNVKITIV